MSFRMRLVFMYKDGTESQIKLAVPAVVGDEISKLGLVATRVYVEKFVQVPGGIPNLVDPGIHFDDFKKVP